MAVKVEHITLQVQQEARRRGMTVEEFRAALEGPIGVIWDPEQLTKKQVLLALRLFTMGEISGGRFLRALPVEFRPP